MLQSPLKHRTARGRGEVKGLTDDFLVKGITVEVLRFIFSLTASVRHMALALKEAIQEDLYGNVQELSALYDKLKENCELCIDFILLQ